jgi:hypothetical protein
MDTFHWIDTHWVNHLDFLRFSEAVRPATYTQWIHNNKWGDRLNWRMSRLHQAQVQSVEALKSMAECRLARLSLVRVQPIGLQLVKGSDRSDSKPSRVWTDVTTELLQKSF